MSEVSHSKNEPSGRKDDYYGIAKKLTILLAILVVLFWVLLGLIPYWGLKEPGVFGDAFGAANALFSGLAFVLVIVALFLQTIELRHQREELKHQREEIAYFLQRGFVHDEGMHLLDRQGSAALPHVPAPQEVTVQPWKMETDAEQHRFIETHRQVFPRHPYTTGRLRQLMSLPGWSNFTAWRDTEIAGNVMIYLEGKDHTLGCIEDLFVQKPWRRQGIASYLLYTALKHFQDVGVHHVQLEMWSANNPALHLYRAFGFSPIDETEIAVGRYV